MKKKIKIIDTVALLRHRDCDFELHLRPRKPSLFSDTIFPLNFFQKMAYKFLRWEYIDGVDYIDFMVERYKNQQWKCNRCGELVDMNKKSCKCKRGPSPWEPVF